MNTQNWQPIDTCPKDNTEFLAYAARTNSYAVVIYHPGGFMSVPHLTLVHTGTYTCDDEWRAKPTHWMPLPLPPTN